MPGSACCSKRYLASLGSVPGKRRYCVPRFCISRVLRGTGARFRRCWPATANTVARGRSVQACRPSRQKGTQSDCLQQPVPWPEARYTPAGQGDRQRIWAQGHDSGGAGLPQPTLKPEAALYRPAGQRDRKRHNQTLCKNGCPETEFRA